MCGIFGYVGPRNAVEIVLNGLKKLEYRGYDSAGFAGVKDSQLFYCKEVGKLSALEHELQRLNFKVDLGIGHTRWATHGVPNKINAHPQVDENHTLAVVHNGIIENFAPLKKGLESKGARFVSDTDTEVIAQLIASCYEGDILKAVQKVVPMLEGSFALAIVHKDYPDRIIAVAYHSPLIVGIGNKEAFISSDAHAFGIQATEAAFLGNREIAVVFAEKVEVYNTSSELIDKNRQKLETFAEEHGKGDYEHYTLKEIHQQPQSIRSALNGRIVSDYGTAIFDDVKFDTNELLAVERILILACGTSWHAGLIGALMLEDRARIPVQVEISSEFRYKNPIVPHGTHVIAISQSGETADTIAAVREVKAKGAPVLAICNVYGSTLTREADATIYLRAGPEIGVCSTKAFTSQVVVLALFTLLMSRMRHMGKNEGQEFIRALEKLPAQVQDVLDNSYQIEALAKKYAHYDNFFFIGRRYMFPTSLEAALKLKEISYINANGYAAGEIKHGPIALLNQKCPVVAMCSNKATYQKLYSNLREVKAREAPLIAVSEENGSIIEVADDVLRVPETIDELACVPATILAQLFAYYVAKERGEDIDQPRNLAKSVTVE